MKIWEKTEIKNKKLHLKLLEAIFYINFQSCDK